MKLAILSDSNQKQEWLSKPIPENIECIWATNITELVASSAEAYFDLSYDTTTLNMDQLLRLKAPVFINEVIHPFIDILLDPITTPLFRLNAWNSFLARDVVELASYRKEDEVGLNSIFSRMGWKYKCVPDIPGLVSARIIAMVINEAYYTLQDEVSTKEEIDIAMKLGTNYPYGPFEWSRIIGLSNIYHLLSKMSETEIKYQPAELLRKETEEQLAWH